VSIAPGIDVDFFREVKSIIDHHKLKSKYVLVQMDDGAFRCGMVVNPRALGGNALQLSSIETGKSENLFWGKLKSLDGVFERKEEAAAALAEARSKKEFIDKVVSPITSAEAYFAKCMEIAAKYSRVRILSRSPMLLLPSEQGPQEYRQAYFQTVLKRLKSSPTFSLRYLFDAENFRFYVRRYVEQGKPQLVEESRALLKTLSGFENLDLRYGKTAPLTGTVIGGESVACIGFKEALRAKISEGVVVSAPELVRIIVYQFNQLFEGARKAGPELFEEFA
jgi:hypothetical protein